MILVDNKKLKYCIFPQWDRPWLRHGFSTRVGGYSKGYFASLNMRRLPAENPGHVEKNRLLFREALRLPKGAIVCGEQVHSNEVVVIDKVIPNPLSGADGFVTDKKNIILMAFFADCVPLFFLAPKVPVVGLVHAGWRGSLLSIAVVAMKKITEKWSLTPADIMVGIGPSIGACCYEVDSKIKDNFCNLNNMYQRAFSFVKPDRYLLDLQLINIMQLREHGIQNENIFVSDYCTSCNPELFYSHRRDKGLTGRMAGLISLV